jgi:RHS repeat-associated protein
LGSVVALSNNSGGIEERYSYDVFGEPNRVSNLNNPYLFTGRRYDSETDLYYYRARYYKPEIGRFLQTDPIGYACGLNLYTYCGNNPINWIDPWGLAKLTVCVKKAQPWGERSKTGGWGHAWIEAEDDYGNIINRGFWPGGLRDDTKMNTKASITKTYNISQEQYNNLIQGINKYRGTKWRKISENCTDFVYKAVEDWAGEDLPGSDWGIDTPDNLAEIIKKEK